MDPAPPGSALVPLLLLLAVPPPGGCCSFDFNPISSTFSTHVDALTPWLILDYPVAMPSNLEMDSGCSDLWGLHFGAAALGRMAGVAGGALALQLQAVAAHIAFVAECHIHDPQGCVQLETVNVSQLLGTLVQHLRGLQGRPLHFPGCARLRCRPGDPGIRAGWDLSGRAGSQGRTQAGLRCWCCRIGAAGEMGTPRLSPGGTEGPWGLQGSPSGGRDGTPQSHGETGGPWPLTATPRDP
ncbi:fms-related tyrosine kinase 3 ligand isoform X2 [Mycteria americana]|uniref:fms-related tyrosine kinase 3 ligand isoform X2 n=1 Tax=Mycteria americana TaxID=33587 RepID=UPI003F581FEB